MLREHMHSENDTKLRLKCFREIILMLSRNFRKKVLDY